MVAVKVLNTFPILDLEGRDDSIWYNVNRPNTQFLLFPSSDKFKKQGMVGC